MSKKVRTEAEEFDALKKIGFEFESPQDEYSYQPDSGSRADGVLAKQEYGVDLEADDLSISSDEITKDLGEDYTAPVLGESEWSQNSRLPLDEVDHELQSDTDDIIYLLIQDSLDQHPQLTNLQFVIEVKEGNVTLLGDVPNETKKLMVIDIVTDITGVNSVTSNLIVNNIG